MVKKKLELERIADRKREINKEFEKISIVYDAVKEGKQRINRPYIYIQSTLATALILFYFSKTTNKEEKSRNMENLDLLQKALTRKNMGREIITEQDKQLLSDSAVVEKIDVEKEGNLVLQEIQ